MGTVVDAPKAAYTTPDAVGRLKAKGVKVVFVLGGPGSGKGTQCANIVRVFGFTHLSAGDLLRAEIKSGSENGTMIQNMIKEGKIVPSEVTIKLLEKAMLENGNDKFLIDGFPRNEENRAAFEEVTKIEPEFVLFFDCPEEEMERRLLGRNQGRDDDNIETIRKRFKVFLESSLPVIEYYNLKGKVRKVDAAKSIDDVFESVKVIFSNFSKKNGTAQDQIALEPDPQLRSHIIHRPDAMAGIERNREEMESPPPSPTSLVVRSPRKTLSLMRERRSSTFSSEPEEKKSPASMAGFAAEHGPKPSEVYGFVGSITTVIVSVIYMVWAYTPEPWLHYLGITYYPSKHWALAVPTFVMVTVALVIAVYIGLNFMVTPAPTSFNTMFDEYSREPSTFVPLEGEEQPIEPISDLDISYVNDLMFGQASNL